MKLLSTGFSWMKETLDFSFWQREKLLQPCSHIFLNLFPSALLTLLARTGEVM
jgi:hypothetical protein